MARRRGLTIGKVRTGLYFTGRMLGDANAVIRGTIGQRVLSRVLGYFSGQAIGSIVRGIFGRR
jgi:hypothetical protein